MLAHEDDHQLAFRALVNGRQRAPKRDLNWQVAMDVFGHGSGYSVAICRRFGFDPDGREMSFSPPTKEHP